MVDTELQIHRLSYEDVLKMSEVGLLLPEQRVELIDGVLMDLILPSPRHSFIVQRLTEHFVGSVGSLKVRVQDVLLVEGGFLVPDLVVIQEPAPTEQAASAELVIEVSVSTKRHDLWKADRYAISNVTEYWIADPEACVIAVHRDPREGSYRTRREFGSGQEVPTSVGASPVSINTLLDC